MRFQYRINNEKSIWEKITIQDSIITLYYRILRGREGSEKDEAIFSVTPSDYTYVSDGEPLHKGLHKYNNQKEILQHLEDDPDAGESLLLHRHINVEKPPTIGVLNKVITTFKKLEAVCAKEGKYKIGEYTFITPEEQKVLIQSFAKYLGIEQKVNLAPSAVIPLSQQTFTPKFTLMKNSDSLIHNLNQYLADKLGDAFMKIHKSNLKINKPSKEDNKSLYTAEITLPLSEKGGKEWFLKRIPGCTFEKQLKETKVTIPIKLIIASDLEEEFTTLQGSNKEMVGNRPRLTPL